mgnify:CR=1 FL=1
MSKTGANFGIFVEIAKIYVAKHKAIGIDFLNLHLKPSLLCAIIYSSSLFSLSMFLR